MTHKKASYGIHHINGTIDCLLACIQGLTDGRGGSIGRRLSQPILSDDDNDGDHCYTTCDILVYDVVL